MLFIASLYFIISPQYVCYCSVCIFSGLAIRTQEDKCFAKQQIELTSWYIYTWITWSVDSENILKQLSHYMMQTVGIITCQQGTFLMCGCDITKANHWRKSLKLRHIIGNLPVCSAAYFTLATNETSQIIIIGPFMNGSFPHKEPVMRKVFPLHDLIMWIWLWSTRLSSIGF